MYNVKMVQTAIWIPCDMYKKLKDAGGKRGLGAEIRKRLEESFRKRCVCAAPLQDDWVHCPSCGRMQP